MCELIPVSRGQARSVSFFLRELSVFIFLKGKVIDLFFKIHCMEEWTAVKSEEFMFFFKGLKKKKGSSSNAV